VAAGLVTAVGFDRQPVKSQPGQEWLRVKRIEPNGKIVVSRFAWSEDYSVLLNGARPEIKSNMLLRSFPLFPREPDWEFELIRKGIVPLHQSPSTLPVYVEAEKEARRLKLGIWKGTSQNKPDSPQPSSTPKPVKTGLIDRLWKSFDLEALKSAIAFWGGLSAAILTGSWLLQQGIRASRRIEVSLLLLGPKSAGKTWLWARLDNPDISVADLEKLNPTPSVQKTSKPIRPRLMGRFEVYPFYIDVPGGEPGRHHEQMTKKRLFKRNKCIFILILSTTPDVTDNANVIDREYISEQLGYVSLPLALISSANSTKPAMCMVVITKFDLFSDREPRHSGSSSAISQLNGIFQPHIARLEQACKTRGIPFELMFCSARDGWGIDSIYNRIEKALFK
jgi:hypothetical protein